MAGQYGQKFKLKFLNGSDKQKSMFEQAMNTCSFVWERLFLIVEVSFEDNPSTGVHYEAAFTHYNIEGSQQVPFPGPYVGEGAFQPMYVNGYYIEGGAQPYDRLSFAHVSIKNGLEDPESKEYTSDEFFAEVCIHEMAHAISGLFTDLEIAEMCSALNIPVSQWAAQEGNRDNWMKAGQEAYAEIFKDLFLAPTEREFDNRTEIPLLKENLDAYLNVLEKFVGWQYYIDRWTYGGQFGSFGYIADGYLLENASLSAPGNLGLSPYVERVVGPDVCVISHTEFAPTIGVVQGVTFEHGLTGDAGWQAYKGRVQEIGADVGMHFIFGCGGQIQEQFVLGATAPHIPYATFSRPEQGVPHPNDPTREVIQWGASAGNYTAPGEGDLAHQYFLPGEAIIIQGQVGRRWAEEVSIMGGSLLVRYIDGIEFHRPGWPYQEPGIGVSATSPGTVRRSRA